MAGFLGYLRFIVRRERISSLLWIVGVVFFTFLIAAIFPSLFGSDESRQVMVEMLRSPAMVGMLGIMSDTDVYTDGMLFAHMMTVWMMILLGIMNIFFVIRHTRMDEEHGRLEMLRSLPIGRLVNGASTMAGALMLNLAIAVPTSLVITLASFDFLGALTYSFLLAIFGLVMAAVALISAQVFSTSRGANGAALAVLGMFYLMRAAGDYSDGIISYISPMGLGFRVFAFSENNVYPIIILFLQAGLYSLLGFALSLRRDIGEGIIPARKGRANAKDSLLSPSGFAVRLCKNSIIAWAIAIFVISAMYGSMLGDIESFVASNDFFKQMMQLDDGIAGNLTESFISMILMIMAHFAVIPVITTASKLRAEEGRGRLEQILARNIHRGRLLVRFAAIAFLESILMLLCAAFGLYAASMSSGVVGLGTLITGALCYLPSMWVFASIGIFLTGVLPRASMAVWLIFVYSFAIVYLGGLLDLPQIFGKISPIGATPQLPHQDFSIIPILILSMLAIALATVGTWRFAKRDLL